MARAMVLLPAPAGPSMATINRFCVSAAILLSIPRGSCKADDCGGRIEVSMLEPVIGPVIVIDSDVMNGTPCFRGTRVPFKNLIDYLEGGHSLGEFLQQFPVVTREMAVQALEEAKNSLLARIG